MFCFWLGHLVLLPEIRSVQITYETYHLASFNLTTHEFNKTGFDSLGDQRDEVCQLALAKEFFLCANIFLWTTKCISEFRLIERRWKAVARLPRLPEALDYTCMVRKECDEAGENWNEYRVAIICLTRPIRFLLYGLVLIPRILITLYLLFLGCMYLTATESFTDLILNSLVMAFVYDIDEMVLECFLPLRLAKHLLNNVMIMTPGSKSRKGTTDQFKSIEITYGKSMVTLLVSIVFLVVFINFQPVLPGYKWDVGARCEEFMSTSRTIPCAPWELNCFTHT